MLTRPIVCGLAFAALAAGCGGAGGERRTMLSHQVDAAFEALPPFVCGPAAASLDCSAPFKPAADGYVNGFSYREWNGSKWCSDGNMHGSLFSFKGSGTNDAASIGVNAMDSSLRLSLTVSKGSYGGGGLAFESGCVDASAFDGVQFSLAIGSGSIAGCAYQVQLQTFEQRPKTQGPPGGCDQNFTTCYSFPYVRDNLPAASMDPMNPTLVSLPFSRFSVSMMPAPAQLVGLQWQVNSTSDQCTVELRIDDVAFIPVAAPPEPSSDDGGTADAGDAAASD